MTRRLSSRDLHEMAKGRPCMWCGKPMASVHIHHVNHDHTDDRIKNYSLICEKCHDTHHSENGAKMQGKYADSETPLPAIDFPEKLKVSRKAKGWSVREGAKYMGISPSSLQRYEDGEVQPTLKIFGRIADSLGVSVDTLIGRRGAA